MTTTRTARFMLAQAANAAERVAALLETMSRAASVTRRYSDAAHLEIAASDLAHHADAIREAAGITADTDANMAALTANPSVR